MFEAIKIESLVDVTGGSRCGGCGCGGCSPDDHATGTTSRTNPWGGTLPRPGSLPANPAPGGPIVR
jgi:hypothetical protein